MHAQIERRARAQPFVFRMHFVYFREPLLLLFAVWWEHSDTALFVIAVFNEFFRLQINGIERFAKNMDKTRALFDTLEHEPHQKMYAFNHCFLEIVVRHTIHYTLVVRILQSHAIPFQLFGDVVEYLLG